MKKHIIFLFAFCILFTAIALGDPPKKAIVDFDANTGVLKATIPHDVDDVTSHYIEWVRFTIERKRTDPETGKEKTTKQELKLDYKRQTSKESHFVMMPVADILVGDRIIINANCSQFGWKTTKYVVPKPKPKEETAEEKEGEDESKEKEAETEETEE